MSNMSSKKKIARLNYKFPSDLIRHKFKALCSLLGTNMQARVTELILRDLREHKKLRRIPKVKITKALTIVGLTELEAKVYLKLLKLKQAKVSELAKSAKVSRTQLYPLLEKLVKKNFLRKIDKPIAEYKVNPRVIELIERHTSKLKTACTSLEKMLIRR